MGNETERQGDEREPEPDPPGSLPEMVIDQRRGCANDETNPQPERLAFHEKIHVAVTVPREGARAKEHRRCR